MSGTFSKKFVRVWIFRALGAAIVCAQISRGAQPEPPAVENRLLLVFDTSSAMKKCLPVTRAAVNRLFLSTLSGQLQDGDTIGVWTFGAETGAGRFPLQTWRPEAAATIASNINVFVERQHFGKSTEFGRLMPLVDNLVQDSERLTVLIFCDGNGQFSGTPYDAAVNDLFKRNVRAAQQAKQPFVIVLRSQRGQYVGCQMSSPPSPITFPEFPPLPLPPPAQAYVPPLIVTNLPPPPPPLIIVGTNVGTNLPPPPPEPTNPPKIIPTNPPVEISTNATNLISAAPTNRVVAARTNTVAPPEKTDAEKKPLIIGGILLATAGGLIALIAFRARKPARGSLITRSMNQKK
jgi:hypothetical protein